MHAFVSGAHCGNVVPLFDEHRLLALAVFSIAQQSELDKVDIKWTAD